MFELIATVIIVSSVIYMTYAITTTVMKRRAEERREAAINAVTLTAKEYKILAEYIQDCNIGYFDAFYTKDSTGYWKRKYKKWVQIPQIEYDQALAEEKASQPTEGDIYDAKEVKFRHGKLTRKLFEDRFDYLIDDVLEEGK